MSTRARFEAGVHRALGLTDDEYEAIEARLGRAPTYTELAMFSVMWSEHCSYKSSRVHLKTLPTEGDHIVVGPGEGAGVIQVAPGVLVAWKLESHNHPSYVEPHSGAATGVGGIVRDILSMGARPIALLDPLRFGPLDVARNRYLVDGVVGGISAYGNSIGVPTVGGETVFEECYSENPLVNVACLGVIEDRLMHGRAEGVGNKIILIGASTGRDGIGGASVLASAEFDETSHEKRPAVQVGDPLAEKLLIEACLDLIRKDLLVGLQDLGAGGISCPTSEMPAKAATGIRVFSDRVHLREPGMEPFEIMISESQERMLAVVEPHKVDEVIDVCRRWELEARVIGEVTDDDRLTVLHGGEQVAAVPVRALAEEGPIYERPFERSSWMDDLAAAPVGDDPPKDLEQAFVDLLAAPGVCSKRWVWEQYDHMLFLGTLQGPGGDAAVIRLPDRDVAVALSADGPGRFCYLDPYEGAKLAVAESARNVACTGARPLAVTNCLNFGNPEKAGVMWQFAEVVRGMGEACRALGTPVTGGNVSFYNETSGRAIYPTPVIGMLGVLDDPERAVGIGFRAEGAVILLLGDTGGDDFGGSEFAKVVHGLVGGRPPTVDLGREAALQRLLVEAARLELMQSAHDLSEGGLAVAVAESSMRGRVGCVIDLPDRLEVHRWLFAETPSRVVVSCATDKADDLVDLARSFDVPLEPIGRVGGDSIDFGEFQISVSAANDLYERSLPAALSVTMS